MDNLLRIFCKTSLIFRVFSIITQNITYDMVSQRRMLYEASLCREEAVESRLETGWCILTANAIVLRKLYCDYQVICSQSGSC